MINILYLEESKTAWLLMRKNVDGIAKLYCCSKLVKAEEIANSETIDLFIVDYLVVKSVGLKFAKQIRKSSKYKTTPIIIVSSGLTNDISYRAMKYGINAAIAKPIKRDNLIGLISSLLEFPIVYEVKRNVVQAYCVSWEDPNAFYEYSPEMNLRVIGETSKEAHEKMNKEINDFVNKKKEEFNDVIDLKTIAHSVQVLPE